LYLKRRNLRTAMGKWKEAGEILMRAGEILMFSAVPVSRSGDFKRTQQVPQGHPASPREERKEKRKKGRRKDNDGVCCGSWYGLQAVCGRRQCGLRNSRAAHLLRVAFIMNHGSQHFSKGGPRREVLVSGFSVVK